MSMVALALCASLLASAWLAQRVSAVARDAYETVEVFANVLTLVQKNYVDEITTRKLIEGAINGMLTSLDAHSAYLTPDLYKELQVDTKGSFGGLGIEITLRNGVLTVVSPIEDTPAFRAGIKAGDQIIKIEDEFTKDLTLVQAVKKMRGPKGTKVHLTLRREDEPDWIELTLTREVIQIKSVKSRALDPGYGYLRITQFQERTDSDARQALEKLERDADGGLQGLVLDLRNNPGGLLSQAVHLADLFLDGGVIVYTEGRLENQRQKFFAHREKSHTGFPMVVLVNGGSASASEIVAGALQDHKRALVLGQQTFGKGSVQTILPLEDEAAVRLTTARYYTPNGRSIQATGITPDIIVESVPAANEEVETPPTIREENLPRHLERKKGRKGERDGAKRTEPEKAPQADAADQPDPQLDRALELLKSWHVFKTVVAQQPG
jgi:carboxyl-terminal processing protease